MFNSNYLTNYLLEILVSLGVIYFTYYTIWLYNYRKKYSHIPGPVSNGIFGFYLGNLREIINASKNDVMFSEIINQWIQKYGKVIKYQILNKIVVVTIEPTAVRDVLISKNFTKFPFIYKMAGFPVNERYLGNGLVTQTDHEKWKHQRGLFNPGFHRQKLTSFVSEFNFKGDILIERLRLLADGKTNIRLFNEINHATLDVIASIAFGMNVDSINDPKNELNSFVYESLKGLNKIMMDPFIYLKPNEWLYIHKYKKVLRKLRDMGKVQIINRIKAIENGQYVQNDLLADIFKTHKNEVFDIEDMIDQFVTFFIAGQETTANALAFSIIALGKNPHVLEKLRAELDNVLGSRTEITFEDLNALKYTHLVFKETLRLWPPVTGISRVVKGEFNIEGLNIPENTWIQVGSYFSGRCEEFYPNHLEFRPERFDKDLGEENNQNYTYFPFSLGPRNCIGQNFAQMEAKVLLAKIVKNFDFVLDPDQNFGIKLESTIRPIDGARCILSPRKTI